MQKGCDLMEHFSNAIFTLVSWIMSLLMSFGAITTPATNDYIKQINDDANLKMIITGDPQVCNYNPSRETHLIALSQDVMNAQTELDAFIVAGDIAENGFQDEFDRIYEDIKDINAKHFIMAAGNHDIRLREYEQCKNRILGFMNSLNDAENAVDELSYAYEVNGYTFVVLASDEAEFEEAYFTDARLQWLNLTLKEATAEGKPVFVITHYPLAEGHGLPNTWGSSDHQITEKPADYERKVDYDYTGSIGSQSNEVYDILTSYKNVFFITGHLHTGFGYYTYQTIDAKNNVQGINVPSAGINNKDGVYNNPGTGLFVEVTDSQVIFYARDFRNGRFLTTEDWSKAVMAFDIQ